MYSALTGWDGEIHFNLSITFLKRLVGIVLPILSGHWQLNVPERWQFSEFFQISSREVFRMSPKIVVSSPGHLNTLPLSVTYIPQAT
ncbi:MAG: hypothetical protein V1688_04260 [bacterium]